MCDRQNVVLLSQDDSEVTCEKGVGIGLLTAYENAATCISFVYDSFWEDYIIQCKYYSLSENKDYAVIIPNLSKPDHLKENYKQIQALKERQLTDIRTPAQLLAKIDSLFPSLIFHDNALKQLKNEVQVQHIGAICDKLMMLENYFSHWDGDKFDETAFPTKCISPQSKETLERFQGQHTYSFPNRQIIVSYHIRYTGNIPGRIYFYPDNTIRKAYVCSLTTKLSSVSNPKQKI